MIAKVFPKPEPVACAALTAAFTVTFNEINPATAESVAPTAKAIPFESPMKNPIITDNPIAIGIIILISRLKNAAAPILTASEISCICFVPGFCLATQPVYMPATANDAIAAIIGTITSIGKPRIVSVAIVYLKNESLKNINQQEILGEFLFLYGSNVFPRNP